MKQNKITSNFEQNYTESEKAQARQNIGLAEVAHTGDFNDLINKPAQINGQVQSNWTQTNETAVDFIRNKRAFKTFVTSYDYPDCMHVRNPGANTDVLVYYPYEDRKKVLFVDGHVYNLKITTSGILPQDDTIESITARLFTIDTNRNRKYLCPSYTFRAGNSVQFDLHWEASNVLSVSEALLDECAPHIEFDCILKANTDVTIYCNGLEWFLNENVAV